MPRLLALFAACALGLAPAAFAEDDPQKLRAEITQLRNRVKQLEKQVQTLQRSMGKTVQRDDALKERLEQREAELAELQATVKELLPNTRRYPALAQLVPALEASGSLRATVETLAEDTGVQIRVHSSVPKGTQLELTTPDLQLITLIELATKNACDKDGERVKLTWTWRQTRGVEIRASSRD